MLANLNKEIEARVLCVKLFIYVLGFGFKRSPWHFGVNAYKIINANKIINAYKIIKQKNISPTSQSPSFSQDSFQSPPCHFIPEVAPVSCSAPTLFFARCDFTLDNRSSSRDLSSINLSSFVFILPRSASSISYSPWQGPGSQYTFPARKFCHIDPGQCSPAPASFLSNSFRFSLKTDSAKKCQFGFLEK